MDTPMRILPIGIQTFEKIREDNCLYVDKTDMLWQLTRATTPYFLSRPRRFGKSLLLSTFKSYFEGRKDLFRGLAIEQLETEWNAHPVLHLDLNAKKYDTPDDLVAMLNQHLEKWELVYGNDKQDRSPEERFAYMIEQAFKQTGRKVVVLIDEYDKPMLQTLLNEPLLIEYRRQLKAFYGVLKSADPYLRFVFLTGVTKFAQVSVFSDLNQLKDISMVPAYATICGITREELVKVFTPEITQLSEKEKLSFDETVDLLELQYDGYHFCENAPGMFNPFSVLNVLQDSRISDYWFQTGTPTYLVELLKESDYDLRQLVDGSEMRSATFSEYRAEANNPIPLLYQSGYLTIKGYDQRLNLYTLRFPNREVESGFLNFIVPSYTQVDDQQRDFYIGQFVRELERGDITSFMERLKAFFAGIPYELNDRTERHYQVVFYLVFKLLGQFVDAEVRSARGRADAVVQTDQYIYVFEFKLSGTAEEALRQIDEKGYPIPYTADQRTLMKVGVEFSAEERNISRYIVGDA